MAGFSDTHIFKGLSRDTHPINQPADKLWDAHNIRLTNRDGNSQFSIVNEKSTVKLFDIGDGVFYIGHCVIGKYLVLLVHTLQVDADNNTEYLGAIYRIDLDNLITAIEEDNKTYDAITDLDSSIVTLLYLDVEHKLNLSPEHPAQMIADFESELIQKVYWTDGINRPRLINVVKPELLDADYADSGSTITTDTSISTSSSSTTETYNSTTDDEIESTTTGSVAYEYPLCRDFAALATALDAGSVMSVLFKVTYSSTDYFLRYDLTTSTTSTVWENIVPSFSTLEADEKFLTCSFSFSAPTEDSDYYGTDGVSNVLQIATDLTEANGYTIQLLSISYQYEEDDVTYETYYTDKYQLFGDTNKSVDIVLYSSIINDSTETTYELPDYSNSSTYLTLSGEDEQVWEDLTYTSSDSTIDVVSLTYEKDYGFSTTFVASDVPYYYLTKILYPSGDVQYEQVMYFDETINTKLYCPSDDYLTLTTTSFYDSDYNTLATVATGTTIKVSFTYKEVNEGGDIIEHTVTGSGTYNGVIDTDTIDLYDPDSFKAVATQLDGDAEGWYIGFLESHVSYIEDGFIGTVILYCENENYELANTILYSNNLEQYDEYFSYSLIINTVEETSNSTELEISYDSVTPYISDYIVTYASGFPDSVTEETLDPEVTTTTTSLSYYNQTIVTTVTTTVKSSVSKITCTVTATYEDGSTATETYSYDKYVYSQQEYTSDLMLYFSEDLKSITLEGSLLNNATSVDVVLEIERTVTTTVVTKIVTTNTYTLLVGYSNIYKDAPFDFVQDLALQEICSVERLTNQSGGIFPAGSVQYACTYSFKYGQETGIFYVSELLYSAYADRGGDSETSINTAFKITITNPEYNRFDYIHIYSIIRSSLDGTATVKQVVKLKMDEIDYYDIDGNSVEYDSEDIAYAQAVFIDTNTTGEDIDSTKLLYMGDKDILADSIYGKDNVLFLGNITYQREEVATLDISGETAKEYFKDYTIKDSTRSITYEADLTDNSFYNWVNQLGKHTSTFKSGDYYRLGIQFQYKTGEWSAPIFIGDVQMPFTQKPSVEIGDASYTLNLPQFTTTLSTEALEVLYDSGYRRARGVVVFPESHDRDIVCQGVINPTVFQVAARENNTPFSFSSWLWRPIGDNITGQENRGLKGSFAQWKHFKPLTSGKSSAAEIQNMDIAEDYTSGLDEDSKYSVISDRQLWQKKILNTVPLFKHVLSANRSDLNIVTTLYNEDSNATSYKNFWYVDASIATLHSPDIEFDTSVQLLLDNNTNLGIRLVGIVPFTNSYGDIDIDLSAIQADPEAKGTVIHSTVGTNDEGDSCGGYQLIDGLFFHDAIIDDWSDAVNISNYSSSDISEHHARQWLVYLWHRAGSLNNDFVRPENQGTRTAVLSTKVISNILYSNDTTWLNLDIDVDSVSELHISELKCFNSDDEILVKFKDSYNKNGDITYYGNTDYLAVSFTPFKLVTGPVNTYYKDDDSETKYYAYKDINYEGTLRYSKFKDEDSDGGKIGDYHTSAVTPREAVPIKYKSTPHAVFTFEEIDHDSFWGRYSIPFLTIDDSLSRLRTEGHTIQGRSAYCDLLGQAMRNLTVDDLFWIDQDNVDSSLYLHRREFLTPPTGFIGGLSKVPEAYLWLCEIYQKDVENRFGGDSEYALQQNTWLPAGDSVYFDGTEDIDVTWDWGDTWYQRYDCLKTYPYTTEDTNQLVEIGSFMCETRVNIDGRYDRNRGLVSNINITPENFNLINTAYSQRNNFFTYSILDDDYYKVNTFPSLVLWTNSKTPGDTVDAWTNVHLATSLYLDGHFGKVTAIDSIGQSLIGFQEKAVQKINFNSRVEVATTDGVPVEIANNAAVEGYTPLSTSIGCQDKFAELSTPLGLIFIDNNNQTAYQYDEKQFSDIGATLNSLYWFKEMATFDTWKHITTTQACRLFYDCKYQDLYFIPNLMSQDVDADQTTITASDALCYSTRLGAFTSFMSYGGGIFIPYKGRVYAINLDRTTDYTLSFWELFPKRSLEYNYFWGVYKPFSFSYISNEATATTEDRTQQNLNTKIFNNIEFKADSYNLLVLQGDTYNTVTQTGLPLTTIQVTNEYQDTGEIAFTAHSLRKKFRIWRGLIPRNKDTRERIRNPWAKITLSYNNEGDTNCTILHNISTLYTI